MSTTDYNTPLFKLTVGELLDLVEKKIKDQPLEPVETIAPPGKKYVYGLSGIADLFGCSKTQAHRIKKSGKIDGAITQTGRLIIVDADKALKLAGKKNKKK